jgi:hypothetical protein
MVPIAIYVYPLFDVIDYHIKRQLGTINNYQDNYVWFIRAACHAAHFDVFYRQVQLRTEIAQINGGHPLGANKDIAASAVYAIITALAVEHNECIMHVWHRMT